MWSNRVGKTSILKAITGHQKIKSGEIMWKGKNILDYPAYERAKNGISVVPQGKEFFPLLTVKENLQTGFAALILSIRFIDDEIFELFPALKEIMSRRGGDLLRGQPQQLAIARALVIKPRLLLLDEPTEGIQSSIIKNIGKVITFLAKKGEIVIIGKKNARRKC